MLRTTDSPSLHAKAAESHGLALFIRHLLAVHLPSFQQKLPADKARKGKYLLEAAKAAEQLDKPFSEKNRTFSRQQVQMALGAYSRFLAFFEKAGGSGTPKCHFMFHLIQRSLSKGNPSKYSTYRDESFNGLIAKIARSCHRRTWANVIHWKCQGLHQKNHDRVRKGKLFEKFLGLLDVRIDLRICYPHELRSMSILVCGIKGILYSANSRFHPSWVKPQT